jgi:hypothetical protein
MTFIILYRTKNAFAEKSTHFGLIRPVIDGFRLGNFAIGTLKNGFRRSQPNSNGSEITFNLMIFFIV